jgi:hypothetical protein
VCVCVCAHTLSTLFTLFTLFRPGSDTASREHEDTLLDALSAMHCLAMCALCNNNKAVFAQALTSQVWTVWTECGRTHAP